jgi:hypothetical protein
MPKISFYNFTLLCLDAKKQKSRLTTVLAKNPSFRAKQNNSLSFKQILFLMPSTPNFLNADCCRPILLCLGYNVV